MNRCPPTSSARWRPAFLAALALAATATWAQTLVVPTDNLQRQFPLNARRGLLVVTNPPLVQLNGVEARLSPGSLIRGTNNLIIPPTQLVGRSLVVNYTREQQGMIHNVWILTPQERSMQRAGSEDMVIRNYQFASDPSSQQ